MGTQTAVFIAGIRGTPIIGGIPVGVSSSGQLRVAPSSQRFKQNIQRMDKASEAILALKPVTFRYKQQLDPDGVPQFGLVAEQVEKVNPDLVARDDQGKPYTVRYETTLIDWRKEYPELDPADCVCGARRVLRRGKQTLWRAHQSADLSFAKHASVPGG